MLSNISTAKFTATLYLFCSPQMAEPWNIIFLFLRFVPFFCCCCCCKKFHAAAAGVLHTDSKYLTPAHNSQPWHFKLYRKKKKKKIKTSEDRCSSQIQRAVPDVGPAVHPSLHGQWGTDTAAAVTKHRQCCEKPHPSPSHSTAQGFSKAHRRHQKRCTVQFSMRSYATGTIVHVKTSATFKS